LVYFLNSILFGAAQKDTLPHFDGLKFSIGFFKKLPVQKSIEAAVVEIAAKQEIILEAITAVGALGGQEGSK
jgi:hypothetical protein